MLLQSPQQESSERVVPPGCLLIKTRKSFLFWDSSVNRPREMSLQLLPWAGPAGQLACGAQLARQRLGVHMTLMLMVGWFPGLYVPPHLAPSHPSLIAFPLPVDSEEQR